MNSKVLKVVIGNRYLSGAGSTVEASRARNLKLSWRMSGMQYSGVLEVRAGNHLISHNLPYASYLHTAID